MHTLKNIQGMKHVHRTATEASTIALYVTQMFDVRRTCLIYHTRAIGVMCDIRVRRAELWWITAYVWCKT